MKRLWEGGRCFWFEEGSLRKQVYLFFALFWCFCHRWFFFPRFAARLLVAECWLSREWEQDTGGAKLCVHLARGCVCKCFLSALSHLLVCTQNTLGNSCAQNPPPYNLLTACQRAAEERSVFGWTEHVALSSELWIFNRDDYAGASVSVSPSDGSIRCKTDHVYSGLDLTF